MKINSRKLEDLNHDVRKMCEQFLEKCKEQNIDILITSTFRNAESQNDIYAQGRTKPGKRVTNARAGYSMHNFRCAFDFVPLKTINNKKIAIWDNIELFKKCGEIGKSCGLEWGGDWKTFKDYPHFQFTNGLTLAELRVKYGNEAKHATIV